MNKNACKDCIHLFPFYGNKNGKGERIPSRFICNERNGTINKFPKECKFYKDKK